MTSLNLLERTRRAIKKKFEILLSKLDGYKKYYNIKTPQINEQLKELKQILEVKPIRRDVLKKAKTLAQEISWIIEYDMAPLFWS